MPSFRLFLHLINRYYGIASVSNRIPYLLIISAYLPFYLFILSLIRSLPYSLAGEIFPCKGTASFRSSSTAPLTGSRIERQPSQIEDDLPVPAVLRCRVGYSVQSPAVSLPLPHFPAVWPACKIYPDKEAGTASDKREEKV